MPNELSLEQADAIIAKTIGDEPLDCAAGCDHCCQQLVVLTNRDDARAILRLARERMDRDQFERFCEQTREQAAAIARLGHEVAETRRWPCPLLHEHRCTVYEARPIACRSVVSSDASCCRAMLEAEDFEQLTPAHQKLASEIGERAMNLQFHINDRRRIDGAWELRSLLAELLDSGDY